MCQAPFIVEELAAAQVTWGCEGLRCVCNFERGVCNFEGGVCVLRASKSDLPSSTPVQYVEK